MIVSKLQRPPLKRLTKVYKKFKGVDFSTDPSLVSDDRSPYAVNLISDLGGAPEKRLGYRTLHDFPGQINGLFYGEIGDKKVYLCHAGTKLYTFDLENFKQIYDGLPDERSSSFFMKGSDDASALEPSLPDDNEEDVTQKTSRIYIICGGSYIYYDGKNVVSVKNKPYVPNIIISRNPDGTGGTFREAVNLLTPKRMEAFLGNDTDRTFKLSTKELTSVDKVQKLDENGKKVLVPESDYTINLSEGSVKFNSTLPPVVSGQDNVFITYTKKDDKAVEKSQKITKCTICTLFGYGGNNRVFLSGNPENPAYIYYSDIFKPNYFPDTNYIVCGSEDISVLGFLKLSKYLLAIKEDSFRDSTVYQIWGEMGNDKKVLFYVEQGISGIGACSKYCFDTLIDEPLFLSKQGVMAVTSLNLLAERTIRNRSYFVDAKLINEADLQNACSVVWNGYYIISVNNRCYVLDSKNKSYRHNSNDSSYIYESYFWENVPARLFLCVGGDLYFGTLDGRICKFNNDIEKLDKFNDDDNAVIAIWSTKNDDDDLSYKYKTMQKKGCSVTLKPFYRSSVSVYASKDGEADFLIRKSFLDILNFADIHFERFTFTSNDSPRCVFLKKKIKKYKRLQFIIKNDSKGEGFGIYEIVKTFTVGNYAKK